MGQVSILFGHLLKFFYDMSNDYALAIILFTISTKVILLPLTFYQMRSMNAMKAINPKIQEINKKYKGNPQKQSEMLSKLYKENNVSPMSGCLPLLIQLPIIMAMYRVVQDPVQYVFGSKELYAMADKGFFWVKSLSVPDVIKLDIPFEVFGTTVISIPFLLPILSAVFTYFQMKMSMGNSSSSSSSSNETAEKMNNSMMQVMPIMMLVFGVSLPSALILYWVVGTLVQILQQYLIGKYEYHMDFSSKNKGVKKEQEKNNVKKVSTKKNK